jgi:hypothetical protein
MRPSVAAASLKIGIRDDIIARNPDLRPGLI